MPTYTNNSSGRISFQNLEWKPGEVKALPYFVPYTMLGLDKTNDEPYVLKGDNTGIGSTVLSVSGETIYDLPYSDVVEVSVWVGEGDPVQMYIGDSDTPVSVNTNNNYLGRHLWSRAGYLRFTCAGSGSVQVDVTPVARGDWNGR